ncbi:MAG: Gldg family protein, partial [Candidatus Latescibacteria bacterium]|nr:Gldg family protein [Candidatus Latescibacterota bacterium]
QFSKQDLKVDFIIPPKSHLPPTLKGIESLVISRLNDLDVSHMIRRPDHLSTADHSRLNALGLRPFEVRTVRDDAEISQQVLSGLVLHRPGGATAISRVDDKTSDHLEFLLATAAQRLSTGKTPHIALISEPPRLSPAEAFEYHQKQLSPPKGADVFSELKTLLHTYGYRVTYINPGTPHLPPDTNLMIWMQPRRDASKITALLSQHLARGGNAIVAMQHYNIQQRQYRGGSFETVYWPQPQYQDLNQYLEPLGIKQVREILMDQTRSRLALETQIYRRAVREYEAQEVALPFLIRTVGPNFETNSPITRQLGDQLFIWGNRFTPISDSLHAHNLTTSSLITTSDRAWAYNWSGGWLPESAFAPDSLILSKQPLAILVNGTFPTAEFRPNETGETERTLQHPTPNPPGQLLLIGSSEMFKNTYLYTPGFQHEQFLLNAVAYLTHGPEYSELQARRKIARGFPYLPPDLKTLWRILVVGIGPICITLYGLIRYLRARKI